MRLCRANDSGGTAGAITYTEPIREMRRNHLRYGDPANYSNPARENKLLSTYRLKIMSRKGSGFLLLSLVGGLLVAQWLMWAAVAFGVTLRSSDGGYQSGKALGWDRASVS